jgi:hypothetical protein
MYRMFNAIVTMLLVVGAARASPYCIEYEPANGQFPEEEGWWRHTSYGGDQRWIEDGCLVIDGMPDPRTQDYYEMRRTGALDPGPGEEFVIQWRIRIDELQWYHDPEVDVFSDEKWAVGFLMSLGQIESEFEQGVSAPFEPGVFHTFAFRSADMRTYVLSIDGVPAIYGNFWLSLWDSRVFWGDGVSGGGSLGRWDYFRFGVVPECDSFLSASSVGVLLALLRTRTWR